MPNTYTWTEPTQVNSYLPANIKHALRYESREMDTIGHDHSDQAKRLHKEIGAYLTSYE